MVDLYDILGDSKWHPVTSHFIGESMLSNPVQTCIDISGLHRCHQDCLSTDKLNKLPYPIYKIFGVMDLDWSCLEQIIVTLSEFSLGKKCLTFCLTWHIHNE